MENMENMENNSRCRRPLRKRQKVRNKFLFQKYLPQNVLPLEPDSIPRPLSREALTLSSKSNGSTQQYNKMLGF